MQSFKISQSLMTLNEYTRLNRTGFAVGAKAKKTQQNIIGWHIKAARLAPVEGAIFAEFRWTLKDRRKDIDNVAFAQKFIFDTLVKCGIMKGDGQKYLKGFAHYFEIGTMDSVTVILKDAAESPLNAV